ncbi:MAG: hypothetical protein RSA01_00400 [Clostridium sp.]
MIFNAKIAKIGDKSIGNAEDINLSCSFLNGITIGSITIPIALEKALLLGIINQDKSASIIINHCTTDRNLIIIINYIPPTLQLY